MGLWFPRIQLHNAVRDVEDFAALIHEKFGFDPEPPYTQMLRNEEASYSKVRFNPQNP